MPIYNVGDAIREIGKSPHIQSRAQAIAIGLRAQRSGKPIGGNKTTRTESRRVGRR